jgi:hypothetical protein
MDINLKVDSEIQSRITTIKADEIIQTIQKYLSAEESLAQ